MPFFSHVPWPAVCIYIPPLDMECYTAFNQPVLLPCLIFVNLVQNISIEDARTRLTFRVSSPLIVLTPQIPTRDSRMRRRLRCVTCLCRHWRFHRTQSLLTRHRYDGCLPS